MTLRCMGADFFLPGEGCAGGEREAWVSRGVDSEGRGVESDRDAVSTADGVLARLERQT